MEFYYSVHFFLIFWFFHFIPLSHFFGVFWYFCTIINFIVFFCHNSSFFFMLSIASCEKIILKKLKKSKNKIHPFGHFLCTNIFGSLVYLIRVSSSPHKKNDFSDFCIYIYNFEGQFWFFSQVESWLNPFLKIPVDSDWKTQNFYITGLLILWSKK